MGFAVFLDFDIFLEFIFFPSYFPQFSGFQCEALAFKMMSFLSSELENGRFDFILPISLKS